MAFNIIDFLLGTKKNKGQQNPQQNNPQMQQQQPQVNNQQPNQNQQNNTMADQQQSNQQGDGNFNPDNATSQPQPQQQGPAPQAGGGGQRAKVTDVIMKIQEEVKGTSEKVTSMVTDMKNLENNLNTITHRVDDLEESKKSTEEKLSEMDTNMTKFLSLYELINNQYNPFVDKEDEMPPMKNVMVDSQGNSMSDNDTSDENKDHTELEYSDVKEGFDSKVVGGYNPANESKDKKTVDINRMHSNSHPKVQQAYDEMDSAILELDTLNIQEAAGDAVPLTNLKTNTNSLVTILSWLEYLIKRVGIDEARNTLRYYTEVLRWITPEVFFDLDKYLKGMNDKKSLNGDERLSVKDHIVSLYFISKLNERSLDPQLTKAVLEIIKH